MARYKFKCVNEECEKCGEEFSALLPMADVGKLELYPRCECCGGGTEKVWEAGGAFKLRGSGWFKQGYGSYTHDVRGNPLGDSIQIGKNWHERD